ncbi:putative 50S ribosomal subunit L24 [Babesia divergens]|uniref:Large ribosomal subunit protein uL24c n=1 Tax=Babesia divergens TaxID=32595 RepID=A0AAD9GF71_BABDI|nr:putative 50S ribosomal subunit L24 [Babesia divergens]
MQLHFPCQLTSHRLFGRSPQCALRAARLAFCVDRVGTYRNLWQQPVFSRDSRALSILSSLGILYSLDVTSAGFSFTQRRGAKLAKPKDIINFWKIRVGDKVVVISGKDKGKVGEVLACDKLRNQVKVKDCNMRKLLVDGQMVMIEKKIHYSNVQLIDPLLNCGTRVSIRFNRDKEPLRVSKKSGYVIPWPAEKPEPEKGTLPMTNRVHRCQNLSRVKRTRRRRSHWPKRTTTKW